MSCHVICEAKHNSKHAKACAQWLTYPIITILSWFFVPGGSGYRKFAPTICKQIILTNMLPLIDHLPDEPADGSAKLNLHDQCFLTWKDCVYAACVSPATRAGDPDIGSNNNMPTLPHLEAP